jgi:AcrR family transcriptional regulator
MGRPKANAIDEATRERLLLAAARAFGNAGFSGARLEDIAAEVGIRRSSLLYHFESKQALYEAVIDAGFRELEQSMALTMSAETPFETRLERVIEALMAFQRENLPLLQVLMRSLLDQDAQGATWMDRSLVPLVDRIETFIRSAAGTELKAEFPVRAAILQALVAQLVRSTMGSAGETLWRGDAHTWTLAQALLRGAAQSE